MIFMQSRDHDIQVIALILMCGQLTYIIFGFHQIINKLTHSVKNSLSCTDLILTTKPNLVVESGVHFFSTVITNYHIQSIF